MFALYKKELSSFFSSLMGYLTIVVFLVFTGLMLWVFKTSFNILDYKYAGLDGLFLLGPFLYLFLIPALTMRMLAEEKRNGTLELLLTKPLSEFTVVMAKFLAGFTLVVISLLPTLVYYWSVYRLGDPMGNIDTGSVVGSYIGLLFLGVCIVADKQPDSSVHRCCAVVRILLSWLRVAVSVDEWQGGAGVARIWLAGTL